MTSDARRFLGWRMLAIAFTFMMLIVGFALYGVPRYYPDWVREFGWKRSEIQFGNTLAKLIVGPLFGFVVGWVIDRRGPRGVMVFGAICAAAALLGFSLVGKSLPMLYAFFFLNAMGYLCAGPLPNQILLSHWFTRLRGRAMGIAYVGIGVGGMTVPWVIHALVGHCGGWRGSLQALAGLFIVVMLGMVMWVRRRPADVGQAPDGDLAPATAGVAKPPPARLGRIVRTPAFWLLTIGSLMSIGAVGGVMQNLALYLTDILPEAEAKMTWTRIASLTLFASIAGRLVVGWLADRVCKKHVMVGIYILDGSAIPLLLLAGSHPWALYVFAACFGFGLGAEYMLIPLMAGECFGLGALSRVMGIIIATDSVGEATMPYIVAHMRDATGSYMGGIILLTVLSYAAVVAIALIRYRDGVPESRRAVEGHPAAS
jgi:sugar phosphate permease